MKPDYIVSPEQIISTIERGFPGWKIEGLFQAFNQIHHSLNRLGWHTFDPLGQLGEVQNYANHGYESFTFLLTHPNGGEAVPDYWVWELGERFTWKPGDRLQLDVNQGWREAWVLAVVDDEALVEYRMPAGSTAMQIIQNNRRSNNGRSVNYRACPLFWQRAMRLAGVEWVGRSQTGRTVEMRVPDEQPVDVASAIRG